MPTDEHLATLRLLQLVSPALPTGAFTYSQGIEWAVQAGWISSAAALQEWLDDQLPNVMAQVDLPVLRRLYHAAEIADHHAFATWSTTLIAWRETAELRVEERNRGRALADLLSALDCPRARAWREQVARTQVGGFALAAVHWQIPLRAAALGYAWAWLENLVLAAVKIIPLGQTAGQRALHGLAESIPAIVETGLSLRDEAIGAGLPALAIASSGHETQYTRLFRS
jgi:urease accessory protein